RAIGPSRHAHHLVLVPAALFFFSSRRRHTRSKRDWSSDVCSSDLALFGREVALCDAGVGLGKTYAYLVAAILWMQQRALPLRQRSEERRVGKESRSRCTPPE